ncbi:MAG: atsA 12 [Phycisphaerales bacterium]|nr:atsA 12 [Phycisphaerales bacterium]
MMNTQKVLLAAALVCGLCGIGRAQTPAKPNVVILLVDDMGSGDVGWRGGAIKTPNMDKLAAAGAKLDSFYVMPVCSPTRSALLTGRYPFRFGLQMAVVRPWATYGLPTDETTLAQRLHDLNYETAVVGKWHLGHSKPEFLPLARGFEHQYGMYNGAADYNTHERDGGFDWHRDDKASYDKGYSTNLIGDEAVRLINSRDQKRPLFLYVPFQGVHSPYQSPDQYKAPYADVKPKIKATYSGMVAAVDEQIGRIVGAIHDGGMDRNTLILFSSDNGGPEPGRITSNGDFRGSKGFVYEGGVHTCACATWPGVIQPGSVVNQPAHIVDWYATIVKLAGGSLDQKKPIDGRDLMPALKGGTDPVHDEIIINIAPHTGAIRRGDWKLVINGAHPNVEDGADPARDEKYKNIEIELFNLATDHQEKNNVAADHADIVKQLKARYDELLKIEAPPFGEQKPDGFNSPKIWGDFSGEGH